MSTALKLKPGSRVLVPWGLDEPRQARVLEIWGDPASPTQIRVELVPRAPGEEAAVLLLNPSQVTPAV